MLYGFCGIGFFLALGLSDSAFSLWDSQDALSQVGNGVLGLIFAVVLSTPLVGNVLFAAGLWKGLFITYAGISAFYLGTIVSPYSIHRYLDLFGEKLAWRIISWLVIAILVGALTATAWWWGLDELAGLLGVREWIEMITDSSLRPDATTEPWFHYLLQ